MPLRFDDTNPETEDTSYVDAIIDDVGWLGFDGRIGRVHVGLFRPVGGWAEDLIRTGLAYVDDQDAATISANRGGFTTPGCRQPVAGPDGGGEPRPLRADAGGRVRRRREGTAARIDMNHENMQMRDPVLYRIRRAHHHRTGDDWCIYPTYDWAHGQSDAIEGVTHSLCTLEFETHRPLYDWFLEHLDVGADRPRQTEFARLELTHTVMSKRKLKQLVDEGHGRAAGTTPGCPRCAGCGGGATRRRSIREFCGQHRRGEGQRRARDRAARVVRTHAPQRPCPPADGGSPPAGGRDRQLARG